MEDISEKISIRLEIFMNDLDLEGAAIFEEIPHGDFAEQFAQLFLRNNSPHGLEEDQFCCYRKNGNKMTAVFLSLHKKKPIYTLTYDKLSAKLALLQLQGRAHDQSADALNHWPIDRSAEIITLNE